MNRKIVMSLILIILSIANVIYMVKGLNNLNKLNNQIEILKSKDYTIKNLEFENKKSILEKCIEEYEETKEDYNKLLKSNFQKSVVTKNEYSIEDIWNVFGSYATKENVEIKIDLEDTNEIDENNYGIYNIVINISGNYNEITNFVKDIEDSNFAISDLYIENKKKDIYASFKISDIKIKKEFEIINE